MQRRILGLSSFWIVPLLLILLLNIKIKSVLAISGIQLSTAVIAIFVIPTLSEYVAYYTRFYIPVLQGERMSGDALLAHFTSIASDLGVPIQKVYLIKTDPMDKSDTEAVYKKDGTLLIRHRLVDLIESSKSSPDSNIEDTVQTDCRYTQDMLDFVCACEMSRSILMYKFRSLFITYFASLLVLIPCVMSLIYPHNQFALDYRMCIFLIGLILLIIDSSWLRKRRDRQVDVLALSVTHNTSAAASAVSKPWLQWDKIKHRQSCSIDRDLCRHEFIQLKSIEDGSFLHAVRK